MEQLPQKFPLTKRSRVGKPPHLQVEAAETGTALDGLRVDGVGSHCERLQNVVMLQDDRIDC